MNHRLLSRRAALAGTAGLLASATGPLPMIALGAEPPAPTGMGLVTYVSKLRSTWLRQQQPSVDLSDPLTYLKHCRSLGAGGMQISLNRLDAGGIRHLRDYAERQALFVDGIVAPPKDKSDVQRFENQIRTAVDVGARAVRTVIMPGRRYERFGSLAEFREFERRGQRMLELAAPIVLKHKMPLAVENHKDQRNDERVALFEHIASEFVGACLDTGNSVALLEDAVETAQALAPWAKTVHLKDQALQSYSDGFLLGDVPLGGGALDLKRIVRVIRQAQPNIRFALELITRDPLKVPCLIDQYWATMPTVSGRDLARTLRDVRDHAAESMQQVSSLSLEQKVALEDANVAASIAYARDELGI